MQMTRRQFGIAVILGIAALALSRMFGSILNWISPKSDNVRTARYWKRADHLAG